MPEVLTINLDSSDRTQEFARTLGALCGGGETFLLSGGLGAGKTCFTQGLARGLGIAESTPVTSPTFTLHAQYTGRLELHHLDLYRLENAPPETLYALGFEEFIGETTCVTAIEWSEFLVAPPTTKCVQMKLEITDETSRQALVSLTMEELPTLHQYLVGQAGRNYA